MYFIVDINDFSPLLKYGKDSHQTASPYMYFFALHIEVNSNKARINSLAFRK